MENIYLFQVNNRNSRIDMKSVQKYADVVFVSLLLILNICYTILFLLLL